MAREEEKKRIRHPRKESRRKPRETEPEVPLTREERMRRKAQQQKQKQQRTKAIVTVTMIVGIVLFAAVLIILVAKDTRSRADAADPEKVMEATTNLRIQRDPITKIHIRAAGDLNITNAVVQSGLAASGYDFTRAFQDVAPLLTEADCTVLNLEGSVCGEPYGSENASAPASLLTALRASGVDLVQMANSYSINNGLIGLSATLNALRNAGLEPVGAYGSQSEFHSAKGYTICNIQGIKVAFVAFTKGLGGMGLPSGSEDVVNLLYKDYDSTYKSVDEERITAILKNVASEKPDVTVALLHWGSEGNDEISKTQTSIVNLMKKKGVDVIIGTHPHLVHKIDFDEGAGTLVAYSLGDFYGNATIGGSNYSIILDIEITKDMELGTTKVSNYSYTPIYTVTENECDGYRRVVRIREAMAAYEGNYVDKVTASCYSQMNYSLDRIRNRISGKG